jgi:hypothetical protein
VVFLPIIIPPQKSCFKLFWVVGWVMAIHEHHLHSEQGDQQVHGEGVGGLQVLVVGLQGSELTQGWGVSSNLRKGSTRRGYTSTGQLGSEV